MNPLRCSLLPSCAIVGLILLNGCGAVTQARKAADRSQKMEQLKRVGVEYHNFHDANKRGPNNWDELESFSKGTSPVVKLIRQAGYELYSGVTFKDVSIGTSNCIMAHNPADVATGGEVLMMDGSVMHMSADELKKALELRATIKKP